jgi:hypothetical protein
MEFSGNRLAYSWIEYNKTARSIKTDYEIKGLPI